jgi:hypothetical protein
MIGGGTFDSDPRQTPLLVKKPLHQRVSSACATLHKATRTMAIDIGFICHSTTSWDGSTTQNHGSVSAFAIIVMPAFVQSSSLA